jgi:hypothetical protein
VAERSLSRIEQPLESGYRQIPFPRTKVGMYMRPVFIVGCPRSGPETEWPLKKLFNLEIYQYALYAAKDRKVNPDSWRGFYAGKDPLRFLVLAGLSTHAGVYAARRLGQVVRRHKGRPSLQSDGECAANTDERSDIERDAQQAYSGRRWNLGGEALT